MARIWGRFFLALGVSFTALKKSSQEFAKQQGRLIQIKLVIKLERKALSRSMVGRLNSVCLGLLFMRFKRERSLLLMGIVWVVLYFD